MEKVIQELSLSVIFVGKWLVLVGGVLGLIYGSISLAYYKTYYEPQIQDLDIQIERKRESLVDAENSLRGLQISREDIIREIDKLQQNIGMAEERIENAQRAIEELGLTWTDKIMFWMGTKESEEAFREHEDAEDQKSTLESLMGDELDKKDDLDEGITERSMEIILATEFIEEAEEDREEVGTGKLGVLPWFLGLLFGT